MAYWHAERVSSLYQGPTKVNAVRRDCPLAEATDKPTQNDHLCLQGTKAMPDQIFVPEGDKMSPDNTLAPVYHYKV